MIANLVGGLEVDNFEKLAMILLRPDTKYLLFKDTIGMPHIKFDQFSAPFFFICRINLNLTELRKDDDIRMDPYMPSKLFNKVKQGMDKYGKNDSIR